MGLFNRSPKVPNRAAAPARRPVQSASEWMAKKPVNTPATQQAEAVAKWKSNTAKAQNSGSSSESMAKGIDKSIAERKNSARLDAKKGGSFVTSEGGRAIDTGRM